MNKKTLSRKDFEDYLQSLFESNEEPVALQMLCIMKFALDTGIFTDEDYKVWRVKAKSL